MFGRCDVLMPVVKLPHRPDLTNDVEIIELIFARMSGIVFVRIKDNLNESIYF